MKKLIYILSVTGILISCKNKTEVSQTIQGKTEREEIAVVGVEARRHGQGTHDLGQLPRLRVAPEIEDAHLARICISQRPLRVFLDPIRAARKAMQAEDHLDRVAALRLANLFGLLEGVYERVQMGQDVARSLVGEWFPCTHDLTTGASPRSFLLARAFR
ncbi:MAG: hypothetical protein DI539_25410 [Flavobacterium psychrophilum]|nr:MAG: hypothetical protein DI539_25410 [Flavobacterium psychrophilum]